MRILAQLATLAFLALPGIADAACAGKDLLAELNSEERDRLEAAAAVHPWHEGRYFEVRRGGASSVVFGTMHMTDPDIATPPSALVDRLATSRILLLEITAEEEARMQQEMIRNPNMIIAGQGQRLRPNMSDAEWAALSELLADYGVPRAVADRMAPWFLTILLSIPACVMEAQAGEGTGAILDRRIEALAHETGIDVRGLETFETLFDIMAEGDHAEHVEMLRLALPTLRHSEDILATSRRLYLDGRVMLIWELGRAMLERDMDAEKASAIMDQNAEALLARRNRLWMETLIPELRRGGAVVAVGALHLGGEDGVLRLLEAEGFTIRRLDG